MGFYIYSILNNSTSVEDIEQSWQSWISENSLTSNHWMKDIYTIRKHWYPTYMLDYFFVGMNSTQRSEGMNSLVKMSVQSHYILLEFLTKFENVISFQREKWNRLDHNDLYAPQKIITPLAIEKSMLIVYINEAFIDFQHQASLSLQHVMNHNIDPYSQVLLIYPPFIASPSTLLI